MRQACAGESQSRGPQPPPKALASEDQRPDHRWRPDASSDARNANADRNRRTLQLATIPRVRPNRVEQVRRIGVVAEPSAGSRRVRDHPVIDAAADDDDIGAFVHAGSATDRFDAILGPVPTECFAARRGSHAAEAIMKSRIRFLWALPIIAALGLALSTRAWAQMRGPSGSAIWKAAGREATATG